MQKFIVYDFNSLINYIENHKETIDIVLCGVGDEFQTSYDVVYRKSKGYIKDLAKQDVSICGLRFLQGRYLWGVIIYLDK